MGKHQYKRLVTLQVGVMVSFESSEELSEGQRSGYAEAVAADALSVPELLHKHPLGQPDPTAAYMGRDGLFEGEVVPTGIEANIVLIEDEGSWS